MLVWALMKVSGADLHVEEYGSRGPTVILVHGGPGLVGYMHSLGEIIKTQCRVVDYHQRGAYKSPSAGPFGVEDHAADLTEVVEHYWKARGGKPIVLGHSWGAKLAMIFGAKSPGLAAKLLLVASGPLDKRGAEVFEANLQKSLSPDDLKTDARIESMIKTAGSLEEKERAYEESIRFAFAFYNVDRDSVRALHFEKTNLAPMEETEADMGVKIEGGYFLEAISKITDPVTAYHGAEDPIPHERILPFIKERLPESRTHLFDRCGHFCWIEKEAGPKFVEQLLNDIGT